jgi:hypothetical protein
MTEGPYGALLRHVYEFCCRVIAGSSKSADLTILNLEPALLKHRIVMQWAILKIKEGLCTLI